MAGSKGSGSSLPWFAEWADLKERIGRVFRCAEPRRVVGLLREGRIDGAARKKGWQLADYAGDPALWRRPAGSAGRSGSKRRRATSAGIIGSRIAAIHPAS
jgi:hypothetical protein